MTRVCARWVLWALGALATPAWPQSASAALSAADLASLRTTEPRAFGHAVGDIVRRRIVVDAPAGSVLDEDSLPRPVRAGQPIELQRVDVQRTGGLIAGLIGGRERFEIEMRYQVFLAPAMVRTLEVPPFVLRLRTPGRPQELRVDAWPVQVSPLTPPDASPREGLGELRPDDAPPRTSLRPTRTRLALYAAAALGAIAYLAWVAFGWPWSQARQRPFQRAWRDLRRLRADAPAAERRAAMQRLHQAINQSAGQVLFERDLAAFVQREPRFAGLGDELADFFRRSRRTFFDDHAEPAVDAGWLRALTRRLRDAERGMA